MATRATSHAYLGRRGEQFLKAKNLKARPGQSPWCFACPWPTNPRKGKRRWKAANAYQRWRDSVSNARWDRPIGLVRGNVTGPGGRQGKFGFAEVGVLEWKAKSLSRIHVRQVAVVKDGFRTRIVVVESVDFLPGFWWGPASAKKESRGPELSPRIASWRLGPRSRSRSLTLSPRRHGKSTRVCLPKVVLVACTTNDIRACSCTFGNLLTLAVETSLQTLATNIETECL